MDTRTIRAGTIAAVALAAIAFTQGALAQDIDFSPAEETGNQIVGFLRGPLATIVFVLAFAVAGFLAAMNRISWIWVGGIILGAVLLFGGPTFVDNLRAILE